MHGPTPSLDRSASAPSRPVRRLVLALALLAPQVAAAQLVPGLPISVEARVGTALPTGEFAGEAPGPGAGVGFRAAMALHFELTSYLAAYGSYGYGRFTCGACGTVGLEGALPEAGFELGVEWLLPVAPWGLDPWVGAGLLVGHRLELPDGGDGFASDAATGWSLSAGVQLPVARRLRLLPGVRYRSYSATFGFPDLGFPLSDAVIEQRLRVSSASLELGLAYGL